MSPLETDWMMLKYGWASPWMSSTDKTVDVVQTKEFVKPSLRLKNESERMDLFQNVLKTWGQLLHSHNKSINKVPARPTQRLLTTSKCLPVKLHCGGLILLLLCDGLHHSWELKVINTYRSVSWGNLQIAWQHFESSVAIGNRCTALLYSLDRTNNSESCR